jgi:uncharacterized membrane protein YhaH (DUF805 family)
MVPLVPTALAAATAMLAAMTIADPATMGSGFAAAGFAVLLSTAAMLVGIAFLLWAGTRPGDPRANAYGQPTSSVPIAF